MHLKKFPKEHFID